jgi:6,7-dimethyl-8-ribityllumazine synthase
MSQHLEGGLLSSEGQYAIVVARWNELITGRLLDGAIDTFRRHGVAAERLTIVHVPGSFEIPLAAEKLADSGQFLAVCCLGAVIQGETQHHDYINHAVAQGLMTAAQRTGVPITFGILTCESLEQALNRAGGKSGNKGEEAALAAIEMASLLPKLPSSR